MAQEGEPELADPTLPPRTVPAYPAAATGVAAAAPAGGIAAAAPAGGVGGVAPAGGVAAASSIDAPGAAGGWPRRRLWSRQSIAGTPLERRLFFVVLIGLLPLALLSFAALLHSAETQRDQTLRAHRDTVRAVITSVDAELEQAIASLEALAASPRLARNDLDTFRREVTAFLSRRPTWENIALYDAELRTLLNTSAPENAPPPPAADPFSVEQAVRTGTPEIGPLVRMVPFDTYAFAVRVPIEREGRVTHVLAAAIRPETVQAILMRHLPPEGGVVTVLDTNDHVVARSLDYEDWLSVPATPTMRSLLEEGATSGWRPMQTLEGIAVYAVYYRSAESGWSAVIGVPMATLDAPVVRSYTILAISVLLSTLVGMMASGFVARTITRPMRQLTVAAQTMGQGRQPPDVPTKLAEISQVADALSLAHTEREALLQRERDARMLEKEARQLAERANRAKDEFLAMLGHELRNPLAAIATASKLLDSADASPDVREHAKEIIQRQTAHLGQMTDDLLDTGRVVMGKIQVERTPLDLSAVVRHALGALRTSDRLNDHEIGVDAEPVWIEGDAMRLEQVVVNLVTNAIKYSPAKSSIRIRVSRDGNDALLAVRDFGVGLEPDLLPRVFDLFVQGQRTLDRAQGGLGIGLTLVRRLVELHDGTVTASSEGQGMGSEFVVRLPAIEAPAESPAGGVDATTGTKPRSIGIVEDNADLRSSLRSLLELAGHRVCDAADGTAGVEMILREQPEVAIVDIGLPGMDGYGVAHAVKAELPQLRVIALTGYGPPDGASPRADHDGETPFDAYVVKPVEPQALQRLIDRLFD